MGMEELPYWLKGYANIGYMLRDEKDDKGSFILDQYGAEQPAGQRRFRTARRARGKRDLWTNMPMLWCLQSYYEIPQTQSTALYDPVF